ncbi:putative membrane protein YgcG [Microbacterium terrae]|uniref:TPM domain-containing protein n=1 Tax=Microbacterium terrae TaxID=69369 RepID=A0A0M2HFK6_9MICO|nr:TPM domain-containing protein [Microbacterium terrae]KJL43501.1 hypothetical protein RS81_00809 [Microbacterium terrae]MBP1077881.1 putative membrane protein YgcG [Microbacterium terrae]GLK00052.1 membrane protein [Microbacterium terrae]
MLARGAAALTAAVALVLVAVAGPASATEPVSLGSSFVLDDAGVLSSSDTAEAEARLEQLSDETDVDMWVVFVDEFTDPSDAAGWANATADQNNLGPNQYLLAVATEGRAYYLSGDSSGPVTEDQLIAIEQERIQPALRQDDWVGAVDAAADGLEDAVGGGTGGAAGDSGGGGGFLTTILVIAAIAVAVILIVVLVRRRKKGGATGTTSSPAAEQIPTEELARQAASALVDTDDAVKTSVQELGFAKAQFGDTATAGFEEAIALATNRLDEAFSLKQQLDDATPDAPADTRAWNSRIIALCAEANEALDAKAAEFDELRKLEQNAPEALARVQQARAAAAAAIEASDARLAELGGSYAPEALATIVDNPDQARARLAFAETQLTEAQTAIGAGDGGAAAVGIRAAEEAVGQAVLLEDAVDKLAADLAEGERSAAALVTELEADIAVAGALPDSDGQVAAAVAAARSQIDAARPHLAGTAKRPLIALQGLQAADDRIDAVMKSVRDAQAQAEHARQAVGRAIMQAQSQVSAAEDYITARRGAVGADARTRLAEAGASLVRAQQLQQDDPQQALQHAQRAEQLAGHAIQLAQNDVGAFGGTGGGGMGGGGGGDMLGAVLGGVLINSMLGGGGSSRSSGGLGGMFGGGGGSSRGGMRPGSFGGGGTRARRGGGRF